MGTALANSKNGAVANGFNPWAEEGSKAGGGFRGQFAKFNGKTGEFTSGQDDDEIDLGTQIIVDFSLIQKGYNCWVDGEVKDRKFVTVESGEPLEVSMLPDHGPYEKHEDGTEDGWQECHTLPFVIDDEDDDNAYLLQLSSGGGINAMRKLYKAYGKAFQSKIDDNGDYMLPLIELDNESYKSKKKRVGTVYNPIFEIVDWLTRDEVAKRLAILQGANEDAAPTREEPEEEETPRGRRGGKAKEEPEEEDEKPARGRRGKAKEEPEEEDEKPARGRRQKAASKEDDDSGIEPEDHGDEGEEPEAEDEKPARGRRAAKASTKEDDGEEDEAPKTSRSTGRRARRFS